MEPKRAQNHAKPHENNFLTPYFSIYLGSNKGSDIRIGTFASEWTENSDVRKKGKPTASEERKEGPSLFRIFGIRTGSKSLIKLVN